MQRTQKEILDAVSRELGLTLRDGRAYFQRVIEELAEDLIRHGRIEIAGIGVLGVHVRPEHQTQHPATGKPIVIPAKKAVRYRSSRELRRQLNPE